MAISPAAAAAVPQSSGSVLQLSGRVPLCAWLTGGSKRAVAAAASPVRVPPPAFLPGRRRALLNGTEAFSSAAVLSCRG